MEDDLNITVNDFSKICRLCLKRDDRNLKPIFKSESSDDADSQHTEPDSQPFHKMIAICCGFKVTPLVYSVDGKKNI